MTEPHFRAEPSVPSGRLIGDRRQLAGVFLGVAVIFAASHAIQILTVWILSRLDLLSLLTPTVELILSSFSIYAVGMPLSLLMFRLSEPLTPSHRSISPMVFCGAVTVCFALSLGGSYMGQTVNTIVSILMKTPVVDPVGEMTDGTPFWVNFLTIAVAAPIMEEVFFRRLVIDRLRRYGDVFAVTVSGIVFGLAHGNFSQFFYATVIGIVLGILYCATGKLLYTVTIHFLFNATSVFLIEIFGSLTELLNSAPEKLLQASFWQMVTTGGILLFYLFCVVCAPIAARFLIPRLRPESPVRRLAAGAFLLNPAFWVAAIVLIGRFVLQTVG